MSKIEELKDEELGLNLNIFVEKINEIIDFLNASLEEKEEDLDHSSTCGTNSGLPNVGCTCHQKKESKGYKCPFCQFEDDEHSFDCPQYKGKPFDLSSYKNQLIERLEMSRITLWDGENIEGAKRITTFNEAISSAIKLIKEE